MPIERAIEAINPVGTTRGSDGHVLFYYCRLCGSMVPEFWITMNSDMQFSAGCRSCGYSLEIYNTGLAKRKYEKTAYEAARLDSRLDPIESERAARQARRFPL